MNKLKWNPLKFYISIQLCIGMTLPYRLEYSKSNTQGCVLPRQYLAGTTNIGLDDFLFCFYKWPTFSLSPSPNLRLIQSQSYDHAFKDVTSKFCWPESHPPLFKGIYICMFEPIVLILQYNIRKAICFFCCWESPNCDFPNLCTSNRFACFSVDRKSIHLIRSQKDLLLKGPLYNNSGQGLKISKPITENIQALFDDYLSEML